MSNYDYDLFVIGVGSGGTRAARMIASTGAQVGCGAAPVPGQYLRQCRLRAEEADGPSPATSPRRISRMRQVSAGTCEPTASSGTA